MYQETLDEIHEVKTIASHITGLGKILNTTEDPTLQQLIDRVIKMLQKAHADPSVKGKSTPQSLQAVRSTSLRALMEYCSNHTKAKKPKWQVLAEKKRLGTKNITIRSSRSAFGGRLSLFVSTTETLLYLAHVYSNGIQFLKRCSALGLSFLWASPAGVTLVFGLFGLWPLCSKRKQLLFW